MKESEYDYRFLVETTLPPSSYCPKCGTVANLYKHGKKEQLFFDLPMHAKRANSAWHCSPLGLVQISDEATLRKIVLEVLDANPQSIEDFKNGKDRAIGFLVGQIMKATKGQANPPLVNKLLLEEINKR
ncbi:transposase family protein [Anoxybacillus kestanbolensis]